MVAAKPRTVSKSEFARLAGVTRPAISIALRKGRITANPDGAMDSRRPENAAYLATSKRQRRQAGRKLSGKKGSPAQQKPAPSPRERKKRAGVIVELPPGSGPAEIDGETYTMAELRKMIADADLKEQKLAQDRGELVTRAAVKLVFARLYSVHASQLKTLAEKLGPDVAAALGLKDHDTLKVQELMDLEVRRSLGQIKKELNDYLDNIGDGTVEDGT